MKLKSVVDVLGRVGHWSALAAQELLHDVLGRLPRNSTAWSYVIRGTDGSPYITRTLLPRVLGHRVMIHRIWRHDRDRWRHNHPWRTARFVVVCGGYVEERADDSGHPVTRRLSPGDVNRLDADDFHRVTYVLPGTVTVGLVGERCQAWGFLVDGEGFVVSDDYFLRTGCRSGSPHAGRAR